MHGHAPSNMLPNACQTGLLAFDSRPQGKLRFQVAADELVCPLPDCKAEITVVSTSARLLETVGVCDVSGLILTNFAGTNSEQHGIAYEPF